MSTTSNVSFKFNMSLDQKIRSVITDVVKGNYFVFIIFIYSVISRSIIFTLIINCLKFFLFVYFLNNILLMNFCLYVEPSVKTLILGYSNDVIEDVARNLTIVTDIPVGRYVDFLLI